MQDTLDSGETGRIENFLLREFNKAGYIFPCKPEQYDVSKRELDRKKELKGGFVLEPDRGLHSSIAVLDFKSMYPSIIKTFNMCPTTLIKDYSPEVENENFHETPLGARFVKKDVKGGIIPKIVDKLMKERSSTKRALRKEADPAMKNSLFAKQWALKIMANAFEIFKSLSISFSKPFFASEINFFTF